MNEKCIELILHAGNATYYATLACEAARDYDFETAEKNMKLAEEEDQVAHTLQTEFLVDLANGVGSTPDVLMIHAQDHVTSGALNIKFSKELIFLYKKIFALEKGGKE